MKTRRSLLSVVGLVALVLAWQQASPSPAQGDLAEPSVVPPKPVSETRAQPAVLRSDRVMVRSWGPLEDIAEALGTSVVRARGPSGYGAVAVPEGEDPRRFAGRVARLEGVDAASVEHRIVGAARGAGGQPGQDGAWHLDVIAAPTDSADLAGWVVAVIDSGVAYDLEGVHAEGLEGLEIVSPWDFVDADQDAFDENQHGTHVASLIAAEGDYPGVAPGVSLMPLRVLDEDSCGTELDLIDAIVYATDEGADVLNLSLSFDLDYVPSLALLEAIEGAYDADVVMVGASGNGSSERITWPAASPRVIAVAALTEEGGEWAGSTYSNVGAWVLVGAPGDALVAETIGAKDPSETALWSYTGTSQAAALVSGAAVWLLEAGVPPGDVGAALQVNGSAWTWKEGLGAGLLDVDGARSSSAEASELFGSVLAYIAGSEVRAHVALVDESGGPVAGAYVYGSLWGDAEASESCRTAKDGTCTLSSGALEIGDDDVYVWSLGQARVDGLGHPLTPMLYATDGLEAISSAVAYEGDVQDALLGVYWDGSEVDGLGVVEEGYTVLHTGSGIATSPLSVVFRPQAISGPDLQADTLDLDASGIATSPLSLIDVRWVWLDGQQILALDGSGIATSPLSLSPLDLVRYSSGTGIADSPLSFDSDVVFLTSLSSPTHDLGGSALGDALQLGGFGSEVER